MDLNSLYESLGSQLGETLPSVGGALLILIGGWFVAVIVRAIVRRALGALSANERIQSGTGSEIDIEGGTSAAAYYIVLVIVLVAFFNALSLHQVSGTLQTLVDQILGFAPRLIAGGVLILVAWIIATIVRSVVSHALAASSIDERLSQAANMRPMSEGVGSILYWLVFLLFLPAILDAFEIKGLLTPVQGMVDQILSVLPGLFGAAVIGAVGWFVARILRDLVASLLAAAGADQLGERAGLQGNTSLSKLVGLVVYVFVFVPALIAALNTLAIEAISRPATEMLAAFLEAVPNVFAAGLILAVAYFVSKLIAELTTGLLAGAGFDQVPTKLGMGGVLPDGTAPSSLIGRIVAGFIMLFAAVEAANQIGFNQVSDIVATLIAFAGQVVLGLVIIAVGFWLSNLAAAALQRTHGDASQGVAGITRFAILGVVLAMGLRAMGLADDIVNLAFGLTLGAVAVAIALSFGLGGREAAGRQMEHWMQQLRDR